MSSSQAQSTAQPSSDVDVYSKRNQAYLSIPGVAGFLEIEEDPSRGMMDSSSGARSARPVADGDEDLLGLGVEPVKTTSGLLLTHRKTPPVSRRPPRQAHGVRSGGDGVNQDRNLMSVPAVSVSSKRDSPRYGTGSQEGSNSYPSHGQQPVLVKATRMLSFVRLWVVVFGAVLLVGTGIAVHSIQHERNASNQDATSQQETNIQETSNQYGEQQYSKVILVPHNNISELTSDSQQLTNADQSNGRRKLLRTLLDLRDEFEEWMVKHEKHYHSKEELEKRFGVWKDNHQRMIEKNDRHGPCKLTKQNVFGMNRFSDLTQEEFKSQFLTGYTGPRTEKLQQLSAKTDRIRRRERATQRVDESQRHRRTSQGSGRVLGSADPLSAVPRHPHIQQRLLELWNAGTTSKGTYGKRKFKDVNNSCQWYNVSCWLRWFFNTYGYGIGGVMTPNYDGDSYPDSVDWSEMGVVSDVRSQGNCGACWAMTAVETIESAYAMYTGSLVELSETEVIACDDSCDMCDGGWPQNAYEYSMDNGGLPAQDSLSYDGDFLLSLQYALAGESDQDSAAYAQAWTSQVCPNGGGSHSGSWDNQYNDQYQFESGFSRYAEIRGYGYATERCICYSDGSGCDCDNQNERMAVRNLATYGPATVCLEASTWQDYAGGIMTSEIGCSQQFMDMNHCVQAIGYAFIDMDEEEWAEGDWEGGGGSGSGSGSNSRSGSQDSGNREGYWIVRNQWSNGWGMNGLAYIAMGENTCGILNDMTQAYM